MSSEHIYLHRIDEAIEKIKSITNALDGESFVRDDTVFNATLYLLVVIGEAVGYISEETQQSYPHIAWRDIKDMRNFVAHEYFDVSPGIIWKTLQEDLPVLQSVVRDILAKTENKRLRI